MPDVEYKVGDKVLALDNDWDITKGNVYEIVGINKSSTYPVKVVDDEGEEQGFEYCLFELAVANSNTYIRILEAMLTDEQVKTANRIMGVTK